MNTLHHGAEHPSSILLPMIPVDAPGVTVGPPTLPCADDRMRCIDLG